MAHANTWGLTIGPLEAEDVFYEIDMDGGGKVLFVEFCNWILPLHIAQEAAKDNRYSGSKGPPLPARTAATTTTTTTVTTATTTAKTSSFAARMAMKGKAQGGMAMKGKEMGGKEVVRVVVGGTGKLTNSENGDGGDGGDGEDDAYRRGGSRNQFDNSSNDSERDSNEEEDEGTHLSSRILPRYVVLIGFFKV